MNIKTCTTCGIEKELSSFYSGIDKRRNKPYIFAICKSCHRLRDLKWKKDNPNRVKEIQSKSHKKLGKKYFQTQYKKWQKDWILHSRQRKVWDTNSKRKRHELAAVLINDQLNACAICLVPFLDKRYDIDHSHETGLVRGVLCRKCNSGLHYFEDTNFIEKAKKYLGNYPAKRYPPIKY